MRGILFLDRLSYTRPHIGGSTPGEHAEDPGGEAHPHLADVILGPTGLTEAGIL